MIQYRNIRITSYCSSCDIVTVWSYTSLRCRWQTRAMRCLTPTVLYTDVDGQCDKLVTDDHHQFITLTVHISWQHLRRSMWQLYLQSLQRYGWCPPKFKWFTWLNHARFRDGLPSLATINLPTKFEVFIFTHYEYTKGDTTLWGIKNTPKCLSP